MGCGVLQKYCNSEMQPPSCQIQFLERLNIVKFLSGLCRENLGGDIILILGSTPLQILYNLVFSTSTSSISGGCE